MRHRTFSSWITCPHPNPRARLRLFCLPCAGGGASMYRTWESHLPGAVELCPVQLPGREERFREPALTSLIAISRAVSREMAPFLDDPFAIFGHSMGALLSFEIARSLRQSRAPAPSALFLSAYGSPQAPRSEPLYELPDAQFIDEMRRLQGTPEAVLQHDELLAFVLPILRADFQACDTYRFTAEPPLDCPLFVYGGSDDHAIGVHDLDGWRAQTSATFERRVLPGHHFFIQSQKTALLADIGQRLSELLAGTEKDQTTEDRT